MDLVAELAKDRIEQMRNALALCYHLAGTIIDETAGSQLDCAISVYLGAGTVRRTIEDVQDPTLQALIQEG